MWSAITRYAMSWSAASRCALTSAESPGLASSPALCSCAPAHHHAHGKLSYHHHEHGRLCLACAADIASASLAQCLLCQQMQTLAQSGLLLLADYLTPRLTLYGRLKVLGDSDHSTCLQGRFYKRSAGSDAIAACIGVPGRRTARRQWPRGSLQRWGPRCPCRSWSPASPSARHASATNQTPPPPLPTLC